jgi:hypothetical protein
MQRYFHGASATAKEKRAEVEAAVETREHLAAMVLTEVDGTLRSFAISIQFNSRRKRDTRPNSAHLTAHSGEKTAASRKRTHAHTSSAAKTQTQNQCMVSSRA